MDQGSSKHGLRRWAERLSPLEQVGKVSQFFYGDQSPNFSLSQRNHGKTASSDAQLSYVVATPISLGL